MSSPVLDSVLLDRCIDDPGAFAEVYERHGSAVTRYVARRVGLAPAEDLTAEVFVRAFRGRARCRCDHDSALPWLLGVASNVIADHRRAEQRRLDALERLATETPSFFIQQDVSLAPELIRALKRIPDRDRDALLLFVWGELSYEETATALNVPVGTVRSRISRARTRLAGALGPKWSTVADAFCTEGRANA